MFTKKEREYLESAIEEKIFQLEGRIVGGSKYPNDLREEIRIYNGILEKINFSLEEEPVFLEEDEKYKKKAKEYNKSKFELTDNFSCNCCCDSDCCDFLIDVDCVDLDLCCFCD